MKVIFIAAMEGIQTGELDCLRRTVDVERVIVPPPRTSSRKAGIVAWLLLHELSALPRVVGIVLRESDDVALVCSTSHYAALLALRLCAPFRRRTRAYLVNFYLHELGRNRLVRMVLRFLLTSSVGMCVYSPSEVDYFSSLAPGTRVDYTPYAAPVITGVSTDEAELGDYMFAGGYTNRDYDSVVTAARSLPGTEFVIVCTAANRLPGNLPANVRVLRDVEPAVFHSLLARSRCVILSLQDDVGSSGQMVALAAMHFGKLTLYTDFAGVSQYFTDGVTGVGLRPRDADDLRRKLVVFAEDPSVATRIGAAAKERYIREFSSYDAYSARIAGYALRFLNVV